MSEHLCNLKGFGLLGDVCPACEAERRQAPHEPSRDDVFARLSAQRQADDIAWLYWFLRDWVLAHPVFAEGGGPNDADWHGLAVAITDAQRQRLLAWLCRELKTGAA